MEQDEIENGHSLIHPTPMAKSRYRMRSKPKYAHVPKDNSNHDEMAELNLGLELGTALATRKSVFPPTWRLWKPSSTSHGQQRRREEALERYKDAKYQMVIKSRKMMDAFLESDRSRHQEMHPDQEPSQGMDTATESENIAMDATNPEQLASNRVDKLFSNALMLPEYFCEIPPDFELEWSCTPFPNGTRCILVARGGATQARGLDGDLLDDFQSALPCGSSFTAYASDAKFTLLDCIQVEVPAQSGHPSTFVYFALDMMAWGGKFYYNCNSESRFWMKSSWIAETEGLDTISKENKVGRNDRIILDLPRFDTDLDSMQRASITPRLVSIDSSQGNHLQSPSTSSSSSSFHTNSNQPSSVRINWDLRILEYDVEGLMFYFNDMDYIYEQTPVMCCLPIKHVQELLSKLSHPVVMEAASQV